MKKIWSVLLCICMATALFSSPVRVSAAGVVSKVNLTIDAPVEGKKPSTNAKLPSGVSTKVTDVTWVGKLSADGKFQAGEAYKVEIGVEIRDDVDEIFAAKASGITATINKKTARVKNVDEFHIIVGYTFPVLGEKVSEVALTMKEPRVGGEPPKEVSLPEGSGFYIKGVTWEGELDSEGRFLAKTAYKLKITVGVKEGTGLSFTKYTAGRLNGHTISTTFKNEKEVIFSHRYSTLPFPKDILDPDSFYTVEQADELYWKLHEVTKIVDKDTVAFLGAIDATRISRKYLGVDASKLEQSRITKVVYNYPNTDVKFMIELNNLQEVWLGQEVDAKEFLLQYCDLLYRTDMDSLAGSMMSWECVIFVPKEQFPEGVLSWVKKNERGLRGRRCRIMTYSGDVYAAAEKGIAAAKDWCTKHEYTGEIKSADRRLRFISCQQSPAFYYSCKYCGKCEYNEKHTFSTNLKDKDNSKMLNGHVYGNHLLKDAAYVGRNKAGEKVYTDACIWCGISRKEIYFKDYSKDTLAQGEKNWEQNRAPSLLKATSAVKTTMSFAVSDRDAVAAKRSKEAENDVNWANEYGLLDIKLLGKDYGKNITRLQLASLAVKLAEYMTEKTIEPAAKGTYKDTDNIYARKAAAAGIMEGTGTAFDPNGSVDRQRMAVTFYQALQYVKKNSATLYTPYESGLDKYSDNKKVAKWAREGMAFMEALGLLEGIEGGKLSPTAKCTIEEAVLVAKNSVDADKIGWYQCLPDKDGEGQRAPIAREEKYYGDYLSYGATDRVWVTGPISTSGWGYPVKDPYTGDTYYVRAAHFKPIKEQ
ncbi:MAG: S-layer homology domain-containing protein [Lachnospiraceae bacterium]|nr:S-layer homology domain-containing protein [Lachnospiraceae bacterium]